MNSGGMPLCPLPSSTGWGLQRPLWKYHWICATLLVGVCKLPQQAWSASVVYNPAPSVSTQAVVRSARCDCICIVLHLLSLPMSFTNHISLSLSAHQQLSFGIARYGETATMLGLPAEVIDLVSPQALDSLDTILPC